MFLLYLVILLIPFGLGAGLVYFLERVRSW
ncbi:hypothetical protein F0726_00925 [Acidithiobacillus caldus]|jgi:hypothetical protein|nr:hypothetical protein F0726_00925 [Acidithiobacillus caldus]